MQNGGGHTSDPFKQAKRVHSWRISILCLSCLHPMYSISLSLSRSLSLSLSFSFSLFLSRSLSLYKYICIYTCICSVQAAGPQKRTHRKSFVSCLGPPVLRRTGRGHSTKPAARIDLLGSAGHVLSITHFSTGHSYDNST